MASDTCRSYVNKKYKCAEKGCEKGPKREVTIAGLWSKMVKKSIQKFIPKTITKKHRIGCQMGPKRDQKSIPKLIETQCQN